MYAGHHPVRYSPHGPGYFEGQRRFNYGSGYSQAGGGYSQAGGGYSHAGGGYSQAGGGYSQAGWDGRHQGGHVSAGPYGQNPYPPQGAYGPRYGNRYSPQPSYGGTRSPSPQWTEQEESVRREHQDSRYNQLMNNSPVPTSRRTPMSGIDNASTIESFDEEHRGTSYTVAEEEPAASVSCTNLLFGSGKKNPGLINCNQVDPTTTEVELNINMPRMKQLEKSVDKYMMDRMAPSDSNLKSAMQAFHCKAEPVHKGQFAEYARYDYDSYYDEPSYIREAYQHPPPGHYQVRRPMPSEVYESALFSEGSASTEEDEEEELFEDPSSYNHSKYTPREIIVADNHDTVSVLSDRHLPNVGYSPREEYDRPSSSQRHVSSKPFSPTNRDTNPRPTSSPPKGYGGFAKNVSPHQNVDENGLKKDSESSSLVPLTPDEMPAKQEKDKPKETKETSTRVPERTSTSVPQTTPTTSTPTRTELRTDKSHENPSFDEPGAIPTVNKPSIRKKAEILTDDEEDDRRLALRSPRNRMLMKRSELAKDATSGREESNEEKNWRQSTTADELMAKSDRVTSDKSKAKSEFTTLEDELMSKSQKDSEVELMGQSKMMGQNVMAEPTASPDSIGLSRSAIEASIDGLLEKNDGIADAGVESVGEEVDYMPSTRAAAALIETMMGTLTKQPLDRISEEGDFSPNLEDLDFHSCDESCNVSRVSRPRGGKKDLYRFL
eukprot:scaffold7738_cov133-Cylindrotheca_fusiformis.AAC.6